MSGVRVPLRPFHVVRTHCPASGVHAFNALEVSKVKAMKYEAMIALGLLAGVAVALPSSVSAQVRRVAPPEGVPRLLVTPFRSTEKGVGADAADEVRQKVQSDVGIKNLF